MTPPMKTKTSVLKNHYNFNYIFFRLFIYLTLPCGMWDLSSPNQQSKCLVMWTRGVLATGLLVILFFRILDVKFLFFTCLSFTCVSCFVRFLFVLLPTSVL